MVSIAIVDSLLAHQHGVISRQQALHHGISPGQIYRMVERGAWITVCPAVYAVASSVPNWRRQLEAAVLSRPRVMVAGRSAAHLLGFSGFKESRPEILVPFPGNARSPIARVMRSRHFDLIETRWVEGFECTTPAETILSLCYSVPAGMIERMVDDRMSARALEVADFDAIFTRLAFAPVRRLGVLRRIVWARDDDSYQPPASELERMLYRILDGPEIPAYERQAPFSFDQVDATVDAYLPAWSMIVEGDGRRWHTRLEDFERDRLRDNAAAAAGLIVVRFTYRMLRGQPEKCVETLVKVGAHRTHRV